MPEIAFPYFQSHFSCWKRECPLPSACCTLENSYCIILKRRFLGFPAIHFHSYKSGIFSWAAYTKFYLTVKGSRSYFITWLWSDENFGNPHYISSSWVTDQNSETSALHYVIETQLNLFCGLTWACRWEKAFLETITCHPSALSPPLLLAFPLLGCFFHRKPLWTLLLSQST